MSAKSSFSFPRNWRLLFALVLIGLVFGGGIMMYRAARWKRFAVVAEGKVYRSGQLREDQFEEAIAALGLKTVICLNPASAAWEEKLCAARGVEFKHYAMHSSGAGLPQDYVAVVEGLADPARQPVLVHCQAGVARTGAAIALYRVKHEGWPMEKALAELRSFEKWGRLEPRLQDLIESIARERLALSETGNEK